MSSELQSNVVMKQVYPMNKGCALVFVQFNIHVKPLFRAWRKT